MPERVNATVYVVQCILVTTIGMLEPSTGEAAFLISAIERRIELGNTAPAVDGVGSTPERESSSRTDQRPWWYLKYAVYERVSSEARPKELSCTVGAGALSAQWQRPASSEVT